MLRDHDHDNTETNECGRAAPCDCPACMPEGCDDEGPLAWYASLGNGFVSMEAAS